MRRPDGRDALAAMTFVLLTAFLLTGVGSVPFHPDETSWLVQSRDLELYASNPMSLAYRAEAQISGDMAYRLLNAPLAKYTLAVGRRLAGYPAEALPTDWDWTKSWEQNLEAGGLPAKGLLDAARWASTLLVALSLVPLYAAGSRVGGRWAGLLAAGLLATNALVLLHGRRAMAEGALTLAVALVIAAILWADRFPWITGVSLGLALSAKQSTLALVPVGLAAVLWAPGQATGGRSGRWRRISAFTLSLATVWLLLNPVAWREPVQAGTAMLAERRALLARQVEAFEGRGSSQTQSSGADRLAGLLASLHFAPPQVHEAANYSQALAASEAAYLANPWHGLLRGPVGGTLTLLLGLFGMALGLRRAARGGARIRRDQALLLCLTVAQGASLLAAVPLAFQRYYVPLVPFLCLWMAFALTESARLLKRKGPPRQERPSTTPS
jgi:4-amino-4-deoxy-L-arabinose transferase-like glycosyltransferase